MELRHFIAGWTAAMVGGFILFFGFDLRAPPPHFITSNMYDFRDCIESTEPPKRTCLFSSPEAFVPCLVDSFVTIDIKSNQSVHPPVSIRMEGCFIIKDGEPAILVEMEDPSNPVHLTFEGGHFFEWRTTQQEGE